MIYEIFIRRPRLASVISLLITIAGLIAIAVIPVAQYPDIAPPTVRVTANYSGADAEVVESAVAQPIESAVNGVDDMKYMKSSSSSDGSYSLSVAFDVGTDPDLAAINVQNRVSGVEASLPSDVRSTGVTVEKAAGDLLQAFLFHAPAKTRDALYISNYVTINVLDEIKRVAGVGSASLFGARNYAMRIWIDPEKLSSYGLSTTDLISAIETQNQQAPTGSVGAAPVFEDQRLQLTVSTQGRLQTAADFENIALRASSGGAFVRLRDVASVELSSASFGSQAIYDGGGAAVLGVYLSPGANAVTVANAVSKRMEVLSERFPADLAVQPVYDTAEFVSVMIEKVITTLLEAFVLVGLVVFLFLGRIRAAIVPLIAVPVAIIGAFGVMYALGYSANTISLLALVLAIGIVVDDAIIVVENVERVMEEQPELSPADAARKAMSEIAMSVIAITLVLLSVFVPVMFLPGSSGSLFREFAVTISAAMVISAINALTLSPALCAILLKPGQEMSRPMARLSAGINWVTRGYSRIVESLLKFSAVSLVAVLVFGAAAYWLLGRTPDGFVPDEDKGFVIVIVSLPEGASLNRTEAASLKAVGIMESDPAVDFAVAVTGIDFLGGGSAPNAGVIFIRLKGFSERETTELSSFATIGRLFGGLSTIGEGIFIPVNPPAITGIGQVGGLEYMLEALEGQAPADIAAVSRGLIISAGGTPEIASVFTTFNANTPRVRLGIDRDRAQTLGINVGTVFRELQVTLGGYYVNDFNLFGRTWTVRLQAASEYRNAVDDVLDIQIRNASGDMVPLSAFANVKLEAGPRLLTRYNNYRAVSMTASIAQGAGTGEAIAAMASVSQTTLPKGYSYEWTGQALEQIESSGQTGIVVGFAFLFAYLFLVALYESYAVPVAVLLSVSVAVLGAMVGIWIAGLSFDLYAQIGIVVLIALSAKNAILINSFSLEKRAEGMSAEASAREGARLRFRPVMMTSFAFIVGLIPLATATGPGAGSMVAVGVPVLVGMLASAIVGIFLIPMLYLVIERGRDLASREKSVIIP